MITVGLLKGIFKGTPESVLARYVEPLNKHLPRYKITSINRVAAFLAQTGHESGHFNATVENLNYSAESLVRVFPRHFTAATAKAYARQPQKIANKVYQNRMGNGPEATGDGWLYRGKGLIQCTGKTNHERFAAFVKMSLEDATAFMLTPEGAVLSAIWFWQAHGLNDYADKANIIGMTKVINGGLNGAVERKQLFERFRSVLA